MASKPDLVCFRTALFLSSLLAAGCAAVSAAPIKLEPLPSDPGPVCADSRTDPKGPDECGRRLSAFIRRNIAATVTVLPIAYSEDKGNLQKVGTGAVIRPDGLVLTAYHVIKDAEYIMVQIRGADLEQGVRVVPLKTVPMEVAVAYPEKDIALLRPRHPTAFPLEMSAAADWQPRAGELLWHFGQTSVGLRGRLAAWPVDLPKMGLSGTAAMEVACRNGDSGGPVVTLDGRLVGIVLASVEGEDLTYFMPIGEILPLLEKIVPRPEAE